jgi:hypothetical protein
MATIYRGEITGYGEFVAGYCRPNTDSRWPLLQKLAELAGTVADEKVIPESPQAFRVAALADPDILDQFDDWRDRVEGLGQQLNSPVRHLGRISLAELRRVSDIVLIGFPAEAGQPESTPGN